MSNMNDATFGLVRQYHTSVTAPVNQGGAGFATKCCLCCGCLAGSRNECLGAADCCSPCSLTGDSAADAQMGALTELCTCDCLGLKCSETSSTACCNQRVSHYGECYCDMFTRKEEYAICSIGMFECQSNQYCVKVGKYDICCPLVCLVCNLGAIAGCIPCATVCCAKLCAGSGGMEGSCSKYHGSRAYDAMKPHLYGGVEAAGRGGPNSITMT